MAQVSDVVSSHSLTEETTNPKKQRSTGTLTSPPPLLTLPFDVLYEILYRLPRKLLGQLRCLCKFFNSLISDSNFAKKHLQFSTKCHHLMVICYNIYHELLQFDSPITSVFSTSTVVTQTQLYPPNTLSDGRNHVSVRCSCDGIFCGKLNVTSYFLWNPYIRKFKLLPPLPLENLSKDSQLSTSFGYDHFIHNYKVIVVSYDNKEVCINTLGTDYWRRIEDFPYDVISGSGIFVSGTVNWLARDNDSSTRSSFILSLDLEKELYQKLFLPGVENLRSSWTLGVVRDCLCVFADTDMFWGLWIMKDYGNEKSWTKLYTIPIHTMEVMDLVVIEVLYISEDDQLLMECFQIVGSNWKLVVYDSKTGTLNIPKFQNNYYQTNPKVYIESLISP